MSTVKFNTWQNTDGTENYKCRAWVNFDGTGTPAISEAGNVGSITDNGAGDYTVNFTTAMPDGNYSVVATTIGSAFASQDFSNAPATGSCRINTRASDGTSTDRSRVFVAIFR